MQKYVIVDIHYSDFFGNRKFYMDRLLGQVCTVMDDLHNTENLPEYLGGTLQFESPVNLGDKSHPIVHSSLYFHAVQLQTLEDNLAGNSKIVTVEP